MDRLAKPPIWWPGCNVLHPDCSDFAWPIWEGAGIRAGCIGRKVGNQDYDGTLTGMDPATDWVGSPYGWALDFDGNDDYVDLGPNTNLGAGASACTIGWLWKVGAVGAVQMMLASYRLTYPYQLFQQEDNTIRVRFDNQAGGDAIATTSTAVAVGEWHLAVGTYDGANVAIYLDGRLEQGGQALTGNLDTQASNVYLGKKSDGYYACGQLAFAFVDLRAWTGAEIASLYADPFAAFRPEPRIFPVAAPPSGNPWYAYAQQVA